MQDKLPSREGILVFAYPDYGKEPEAVAASGARGSRTIDFSDVYFEPLPGVRGEAMAIKSLMPEATVMMGEAATEGAVKQVAGPRILHIATHGFFLDDVYWGAASAGSRGVKRREGGVFNEALQNPLLRSGLAFAGANQRQSGKDDGILTALEAAGLDLWGTKLVVLSACETGI